jgi:hypothetical protein
MSKRAGLVAKSLYYTTPLLIVVGSISCATWAIGTAMSVALFSLALLIHIPTFIVSGNTNIMDAYANISELPKNCLEVKDDILDACINGQPEPL